MKKLILLLITILSVHMSFAQIKCGTKDTFTIPVEQIVYYDANDSINSAVGLYKLDSIESSITSSMKFKKGVYHGGTNNDPIHVPLKFIVIKGYNGIYDGEIFAKVNELVRDLNVLTQIQGIALSASFYLEEFDFISNKPEYYYYARLIV
jgi:hypothetical protein